MPTRACWHCPLEHPSPERIYTCEGCGRATCSGEVYAAADGYELAHREPPGVYCGPVRLVGLALPEPERRAAELEPMPQQ
jgi:hypothetical protein